MDSRRKTQCQLCLQEKQLIKAHIIPEGFFRPLRSDGIAAEMHTNSPGQFPKRMQIGVYDSNILCADCDQIMAPWDAHAQEVLLQRFTDASVLEQNEQALGWKIENFNYRRLKLFFMSLAWRASVSQHSFYKRISLGPIEPRLKRMILSADLGNAEDFAVLLGRFDNLGFTGMLDPHPEKFSGISFVRFYLTGFVALIKVDKRPTPKPFSDFYMREDTPLFVIPRSLHNSSDGRVLRKIAEDALVKKNRKRDL